MPSYFNQAGHNPHRGSGITPFNEDSAGAELIKIQDAQNLLSDSDKTGEDPVFLRTFDDSSLLVIDRASVKEGPINLVRSRKTSSGFFDFKFCTCVKISGYQQYFDVTTDLVWRRLKFAVLGHLIGEKRPDNIGQMGLDYDLYTPFWLMITLIV
jgi:hypothetical protein